MTPTVNPYHLAKGAHPSAADGRCAMEWVAFLANEPHSDTPRCVSPILTRFCIALNDRLGDKDRQKLRPYLARTIGTRDDGMDAERIRICKEWLVQTSLPRSLELAGRHDMAEQLRAMPAALAVENVVRLAADARDACFAAGEEKWADLRKRWPHASSSAAADAYVAASAAVAAYAAAADAVDGAADAYVAASAAVAAVAAYAATGKPSKQVYAAARAAADEALKPHVERSKAEAFELLERLLPKVMLDLPAPVTERVRELEEAGAR